MKQEHNDENVKDDDGEALSHRTSNASQQRSLKEMARKLWLAVEVGDRLSVMKIL